MSRISLVAATVLAAGLLAPATSLAGGFATVGLSSLPGDARPGDEWVVDVTVLQHGVTPLEGVEPRVMIAPAGERWGSPRASDALPTDRAGVYRARVEFPSEGEWSISVDDGFAGIHEFWIVRIGERDTTLVGSPKFNPIDTPGATGPATAGGGGSEGASLGGALGIAALAGLLAAAFTGTRRRWAGAG